MTGVGGALGIVGGIGLGVGVIGGTVTGLASSLGKAPDPEQAGLTRTEGADVLKSTAGFVAGGAMGGIAAALLGESSFVTVGGAIAGAALIGGWAVSHALSSKLNN